jgi:hypothetical protein
MSDGVPGGGQANSAFRDWAKSLHDVALWGDEKEILQNAKWGSCLSTVPTTG